MERKYFIDWIRVLAFFLLIFFHCTMPFVTFGWEIKNTEQSASLSSIIFWLHQWRLPLLFFISGVGIHFSLNKRSVLSFALERVIRLLIPLLFAMFFVIPLQVYYEKLQTGQITSSYIKFYPTVWNMIPYPDGTLNWSHMWFVVYLFVYCILLLPVFGLFKINTLKRWKEFIANKLSSSIAATLLFIPLAICFFTLYLEWPEQLGLLDDWFVFTFSLTLLLLGYVLGGSARFWDTCEKYRTHFLIIAVVCIMVLFYNYWWKLDIPKQKDFRFYVYGIVNAIHIWLLIMAIAGYAKKYLNYSIRFLQYANQAVYPFYILHQTLIVAFGFYIVQWPLPIFIKIILLLISCFAALVIIYQWVIKPFVLTRILYGLKPKEKKLIPPGKSNDHS